jgi:hypothetical protein
MVRYLPLSLLKEKVPYRIIDVRDYGHHIFIQIREYNFSQHQIETLLLNPQMVEAFRWAVKFNKDKNGEAFIMHFKYYGYCDGRFPIVRIPAGGSSNIYYPLCEK